MRTIKKELFTEGNMVHSLEWDAVGDYGKAIQNGVYIYRIIIRTKDGREATANGRIILSN